MLFIGAFGFGFTLFSSHAADLDFEGLPAGQIVDTLSQGQGISGNLNGSVEVFGFNPNFGMDTNTAVVFDSNNPTGNDVDLGSPNQTCGGPGVGEAGEVGKDTENCDPLNNILIVDEHMVDSNGDGLIDDPDDADLEGEFINFDFSLVSGGGKKNQGLVTVNSVKIFDVEGDEIGPNSYVVLSGPKIPTAQITVPVTGNNGIIEIDEIGLEGVRNMRVYLNGSGSIDSVAVNEDLVRSCWITTGGFHNAGVQAGPKTCTFGGNVGPPASGDWEVIDHSTGDNFHAFDVNITVCETIDATGPGQPGGKKGFDINKASFAGSGRLNGVDGYPFEGFVIDAGEPGGKKNNDKDQFSLTAHDPYTDDVVFQCTGELDGGNVQIHPPVGKP